MCTLIPITKQNCPTGRAGISQAWTIASEKVQSLTFDADGQVIAITLVNPGTDGFVPIQFEKDVGFFNQEKTRINNRSNLNVAQTFQFNNDIMNATTRKALLALNKCCSQHTIIRDNTGRFHYAGITHVEDETNSPADDTYITEDFRTGDGSGNTGADPTADNNEYVESMTANVGWYAPFFTGGEAGIPIQP